MPAHFIAARDPLILSEAVAAHAPAGVEISRHYASELNMETVFDQLGSADLFASERCFLYVDILDFKPTKKDTARLEEILGRLTGETTLIVTQLFSDPEKRSDEERRLKTQVANMWRKHAKFSDFRRHSDPDNAVKWLVQRAPRKYGIEITARQAMRMLQLCTEQIALADAELAKLSLSLEQGGPVSDELLEETVKGSPAAKFYELADSVLGCAPDAQQRLLDWFRAAPDTFRLVNELKRRFSGMRTLRSGGNVYPPFFARSLQQFQRRYPGPAFSASVELLAQLEQDLKGGIYAGANSKDAELTALQVFVTDLRRLAG